jgi:ribosomal protein S2
MASAVDVDIKKLLESGAHFGHKTSRWHPIFIVSVMAATLLI